MLVRFSTRFGHLLMQGEPALALLRLAGHTGTVPGAVLEADLPAFLARIRSGLAQHGDDDSPVPAAAEPDLDGADSDESRDRSVKLRMRAMPLVDMIETALRQHSDLMWDDA